MRIPAAIVLILILVTAGGCSLGSGNLSSLPAYVSIGSTVLTTEMRVELISLDDEELAERLRIMEAVTPTLDTLAAHAATYQDDLAAEVARREAPE